MFLLISLIVLVLGLFSKEPMIVLASSIFGVAATIEYLANKIYSSK